MRVLRVYHAAKGELGSGRLPALREAGATVVQVAPAHWGDPADRTAAAPPDDWIQLPVSRPGDVNRHSYVAGRQLEALVADVRPDLLDVHEEPFSLASRQWLRAAKNVPVVMYTAQNLDKRLPPPFHQYEQAALRRVAGFYPCSRQAASVIRGKGYAGRIRVLPLGFDDTAFRPGEQSVDDDPIVLALVGRLVPEKGVRDAVHVLAAVRRERKATLLLIGQGPEEAPARDLAAGLGVGEDVQFHAWAGTERLAALYRSVHLLLVPSRSTATWVEQFGRVIVEAQASGAVVAGYASGAIPEVIADAGPLVPEGRVDVLAGAVTDLLEDAGRYDALRARGIRQAQERSWHRVARAQVDLYRAALEGPDPTAVGRAAAAQEFGSPATALGQRRPFALPGLRNPSAVSRLLGAALDVRQRLGRPSSVSRR